MFVLIFSFFCSSLLSHRIVSATSSGAQAEGVAWDYPPGKVGGVPEYGRISCRRENGADMESGHRAVPHTQAFGKAAHGEFAGHIGAADCSVSKQAAILCSRLQTALGR